MKTIRIAIEVKIGNKLKQKHLFFLDKIKMESRQIIVLIISGLLRISGAFPANGDLDYEFRANAELVCYECARTPDNDTCAFELKHIPEVTAVGQVRTHDLLIL